MSINTEQDNREESNNVIIYSLAEARETIPRIPTMKKKHAQDESPELKK